MSQIFAIMRIEWRRQRLPLLLASCFILLLSLLAFSSGYQAFKHQRVNAQQLMQQSQKEMETLAQKTRKREKALTKAGKALSPDKKSYRNPAHVAQQGTLGLLPASSLSILIRGQNSLLPQGYKISLKDSALLETQENLEHPLQLWSGYFDLSFVWIYLMPLLFIALSFDLTSGEQQAGTLKMLLIQGGELQSLIWGKIAARLGLWAWLLFLSNGVVILGFQGLGLSIPWIRLGAVLVILMFYGCFWVGLMVYLNALAWKPTTIAAALASIWLSFAWLIPASSEQVLQVLSPAPSRMETIQAYREASEHARRESSQLLGKYLEDHPELSGGTDNRYAMLQLSKEAALAKAVRPIAEQQQRQLQQQQRWGKVLSFLSPMALSEQMMMRLAGSDLTQHQEFRLQVNEFQKEWLQFFLPLIQQNQALSSQSFTQLPRFQYRPPALSQGALLLGIQVLYLCALTAVLLQISLKRYRQYRVVEDTPS